MHVHTCIQYASHESVDMSMMKIRIKKNIKKVKVHFNDYMGCCVLHCNSVESLECV